MRTLSQFWRVRRTAKAVEPLRAARRGFADWSAVRVADRQNAVNATNPIHFQAWQRRRHADDARHRRDAGGAPAEASRYGAAAMPARTTPEYTP
jgi:hypothetical protein